MREGVRERGSEEGRYGGRLGGRKGGGKAGRREFMISNNSNSNLVKGEGEKEGGRE